MKTDMNSISCLAVLLQIREYVKQESVLTMPCFKPNQTLVMWLSKDNIFKFLLQLFCGITSIDYEWQFLGQQFIG